MRIETSQFVVGKTYRFTDPYHPGWVGLVVRAEPANMMRIMQAKQSYGHPIYKAVNKVITRGGFAHGEFWSEVKTSSFGQWFKEHS